MVLQTRRLEQLGLTSVGESTGFSWLERCLVTAEAVGSTRIISSPLVTPAQVLSRPRRFGAGIPLRAPLMVSEEHVATNRSAAVFTGPHN